MNSLNIFFRGMSQKILLSRLIKTLLVLAMSFWLLVACSSLSQQQPTYYGAQSMNDTMSILQEGAKRNEQLAQSGSTAPGDVQSALLPGLSIDNTTSNAEEQKPRFNVSANNVDARSFFMSLVKGTQYNMVVSPKVEGAITLNLQNVTIDEVLQAVQDIYGYQYHKTDYGYQVFPAGLETKTFVVNYLDVDRTGKSNMTVSGGGITQTSTSGSTSSSLSSASSNVDTTSESKFWDQLKTTLVAMIGDKDGRQVIINPDAGVVVVRAYPKEFEEVSKYLDSIQNNMTREVIIEAKVLEVTLSADYQAGIDWSLLGASQTTTGAVCSIKALTPAIFSLEASFGNAFTSAVKLLSTQGNVQTLSNPRISTLNNQMAVIKVGDDEFFVTDVTSTTTGSGTTAQDTQGLTLTPFFSGIALDVTPQIAGNGDVILHIHPVISTVSDGTKTFTVGGKTQTLPLALSKIRESDSIVRVKNGQMIIIGGLMENDSSEKRESTPFLDKTPMIGALFKRNDQSSTRSELIILLLPTIVDNDTWSTEMKNTSGDFKKLDRGFASPSGHPKVFGSAGHQKW